MDATINEGEKFKEDLEMTSTAGDCNGARLHNQTKGYAVTGRVWINVCVCLLFFMIIAATTSIKMLIFIMRVTIVVKLCTKKLKVSLNVRSYAGNKDKQ